MIDRESLLTKIKSKGYWRIHFEPSNNYIENLFPTPLNCKEFVEKNWVDFTGWDFPHFPTHNDTYQEIGTGDGFCEALTDFSFYKEFWRLYTSGQFISYIAFYEDWYEDIADQFRRKRYINALPVPGKCKCIGVYYNIFKLCFQIFEFLSRFAAQNFYKNGVEVNIKLFNLVDRQLWGQNISWETSRGIYQIRSNELNAFNQIISQQELITDPMKIARKCILKIVNSFGWNPSELQIEQFQNRIIKGE